MVYDTYDIQAKGLVDSSGKCETKSPSNKRQIITIIHAGSENGWIPNNALLLSTKKKTDSSLDYHKNTTAELFENCFKNLLSNIPNTSVIVMSLIGFYLIETQESCHEKWITLYIKKVLTMLSFILL